MDTNFSDGIKSEFTIKPGACCAGFIRVLLIALIPVICLWLIDASPAAAQSAGEYFQIDYSSANLSQSEVQGSGVFYAVISGKVTCTKDLPMSVSEASIISRITATNTVNGARITLNAAYTLSIKPFPSKAGDITDISQRVPLQFADGVAPGDYSIVAELMEAKVKAKVAFIESWVGVTDFLPKTQPFGSVKYTSPGETQSSLPVPVVTSSTPTPQPAQAPAPLVVRGEVPKPALRASGFAWWIWAIVAIAIAITVLNIARMLRNRAGRH